MSSNPTVSTRFDKGFKRFLNTFLLTLLKTRCYNARLFGFPDSSAVEQVTVNHWVGGSSPSRGANSRKPVQAFSKISIVAMDCHISLHGSTNFLRYGVITMKGLTALGVAAALSLGITNAYAGQNEGGFSIGVKGGYNTMDFPTNSQELTDDDGDSLVINGKKDEYIAGVHVDYLWPVADFFELGSQLGYSYYGKYKTNYTYNGVAGSTTYQIGDASFQLVAQWNIQKFFLQLRGGAGYFHTATSNSGADLDPTINKNTWNPLLGASAGLFLTDNFSAEIFVDHVFGQNYGNFIDLANADTIKPATMTSVGLGVAYTF